MRQLATIRKIDNLLPIEGADLIVTAVIGGWTVVVKKNEFKIGDLCLYCEIDSFLPDGHPAWQHLVEKHPRIFEGNRGHRLRTVKLRGQLSQGFAAPIHLFFKDFVDLKEDEGQELSEYFFVGNDLTQLLGIKKFELPIPTELAGKVNGNFPIFIKKTDQERCQNIIRDIFVDHADEKYEVSIKLDGTSFTAYHNNGKEGVCSRNWELSLDDSNATNSLVRMYIDSGLQESLRKLGKNIAIQGELMGPGIAQNREGFEAHKLFVFNIYDIDAGQYLGPESAHFTICGLWADFGLKEAMVEYVPVVHMYKTLHELGITSIQELLAFAEGKSINHPIREGLVFKSEDGSFTFKVISNKFLLKED